ncbi:MAG: hypothetical protein ACE5IG_02440, partial [Dehalococcoidia bacterium]
LHLIKVVVTLRLTPYNQPTVQEVRGMWVFFRIPAAGAGFFFSAWLAMLFWGIIGPELDLGTIDYPMAMLVTIALWLVLAPLIGATRRR